MLLSDLAKISFSFCFGFLLAPFSWGILYLPIFIIIFGSIDYLFFKGEFNYEYFEHRGSIIFYGILGFIVGRVCHNLTVGHVKNFHKKLPKKELKYNFYEKLIKEDLSFISNIKKGDMINIADRYVLNRNDIYYSVYRFFIFSHPNNIYKFINETIQNSIHLSSIKDGKEKQDIINKIKNCVCGIENLRDNYKDKDFHQKINLIINKIDNLK